MSTGLPSSLLRQHAIRFSQGNLSLDVYREKRTQIINNLVDMHIPSTRVSLVQKHVNGASSQASQTAANEERFRPLTASHIVLLSVMSFTAASMSILPNARMTLAAVSSAMALATPVVADAEAVKKPTPTNEFLIFANNLSLKTDWKIEDIDRIVALWQSLDNEQRYSARRYTTYHLLLDSSARRAIEFRELAEVSNLGASLEIKAQEVDRVTRALLIH